MMAIPNRFKQTICEPQHHDILHSLFSQIVINAINLMFVKYIQEFSIESLRRSQINSKWFLEDEAAPCPVLLASETRLAKTAPYRRECRWRRRQIEKAVAASL